MKLKKEKSTKALRRSLLTVLAVAIGSSTLVAQAYDKTRTGVKIPGAQQAQLVKNARLPADVDGSCLADLKDWFVHPDLPANGDVMPPQGLNPEFADFATNTRCDFYQWGQQMFLWLTSETANGWVFNTSPVFFNVSTSEDGSREFLKADGTLNPDVRGGKEDIEFGQASGGDVLLAQDGSLVYYAIHANNGFAWFRTMDTNCTADPKSSPYCSDVDFKDFPADAKNFGGVEAYAGSFGTHFGPSGWALTMELKTSWVDIDTVANPDEYITTTGMVPIFDRAAPGTDGYQQWSVTKYEEKTLAMVGMHVVGTVDGHPEMIWATFEHVNNVPDNKYIYQNYDSTDSNVDYDSEGDWVFLPDGGKPNGSTIQDGAVVGGSIKATGQMATYFGSKDNPNNDPECKDKPPVGDLCIINTAGNNISPNDVIRVDPWGTAQDGDPSNVANTTDLVSINVSTLSQLKSNDIRGNYIQTGSIWSVKGDIPTGSDPDGLSGSLKLANTTMETFDQQSGDSGYYPVNCFGCHSASAGNDGTDVSHIYGSLEPLFEVKMKD